VTFIRSHVTGSNDAILSEVGRTMAVSLVGTHHGPGMHWDTSWSRWATSLGVSISMTYQDWLLSSPLYLCLPNVWGAAGGDLLNPQHSWDRNE
jgi:hypothetical protein